MHPLCDILKVKRVFGCCLFQLIGLKNYMLTIVVIYVFVSVKSVVFLFVWLL